jgi:hypothetical protein
MKLKMYRLGNKIKRFVRIYLQKRNIYEKQYTCLRVKGWQTANRIYKTCGDISMRSYFRHNYTCVCSAK